MIVAVTSTGTSVPAAASSGWTIGVPHWEQNRNCRPIPAPQARHDAMTDRTPPAPAAAAAGAVAGQPLGTNTAAVSPTWLGPPSGCGVPVSAS